MFPTLARIAAERKDGKQIGDGFQENFGIRGAEGIRRGKRTKDADGADSSGAGHLDVLGRISHINGIPRLNAHAFQSQFEGRGVGFSSRRVFGENADGKGLGKLEFIELPADAVAGAAGHNAELKAAGQGLDDVARAGKEFGVFVVIGLMPQVIGLVPFVAGKIRRFVDAKPIRRIVELEIVKRPRNAESAEHGEIGARIGCVGIEESAVPIEKDSTGMKNGPSHRKRIVSENAESVAVITRGKLVVALEGDIVKARGVAPPTGYLDVLGADDVSGGEQLDAAHAERTVDKSDLKFDGSARLDVARSQEIDAAGADVASDESDGIRLDGFTDSNQAHGQT